MPGFWFAVHSRCRAMRLNSSVAKPHAFSEPAPTAGAGPADSVPVGELRVEEEIFELLQGRLGPLHAKLRLGIEADHEAQVFGQGINYFHPENLRWSHLV